MIVTNTFYDIVIPCTFSHHLSPLDVSPVAFLDMHWLGVPDLANVTSLLASTLSGKKHHPHSPDSSTFSTYITIPLLAKGRRAIKHAYTTGHRSNFLFSLSNLLTIFVHNTGVGYSRVGVGAHTQLYTGLDFLGLSLYGLLQDPVFVPYGRGRCIRGLLECAGAFLFHFFVVDF